MNMIALLVGYAVIVAAGIALAAAIMAGACYYFNLAMQKVLDAHGGWGVFMEYREWYHANKKGKP